MIRCITFQKIDKSFLCNRITGASMDTQCCRIALQVWPGTKTDSVVIGQQPIRVLLQPPQLPLWNPLQLLQLQQRQLQPEWPKKFSKLTEYFYLVLQYLGCLPHATPTESCPTETYWNAALKYCDWPANVNTCH
jgi:hypothetical protein